MAAPNVKSKQPEKEEKESKKPVEEEHETLIRILSYDIPGSKNIYTGLTKIKGVSWSLSNAICTILDLPREKKFSELSKDELGKIEAFIKEGKIPVFLMNRRLDPESGESRHKTGSDLDITKDFDIKRLKKIKSYKGLRHSMKLPVRGQRTRSNFRGKGVAVGVVKRSEKSTQGGKK